MAQDATTSEPAPRKPPPLSLTEIRRWTLFRERRYLHMLRAALVGLLAGAIAVLFREVLDLVHQGRMDLSAQLKSTPQWGWIILPILGALGAGLAHFLTQRFAPEAAGSGIPHVKAVLLHLRPLHWERLLPVKFVGGVLAIGAGLSLGREGPTVQMGAAVGNIVSRVLRVPRKSQLQLVSAGAGAGLAAAFNAPLAGFIFTIEELQREMSPLTYSTALVAAILGDVVTRSWTGQSPSFHFTGYPTPELEALPLFVAVGIVGGLAGVGFSRGLLWSLDLVKRHTWMQGWRFATLVGAGAGLIAWWLPEAVGSGHLTAEAMLNGDYDAPQFVQLILLLFIVKFVLTLASYACGVPGGIFAPLLVLGVMVGMLVGHAQNVWFPGLPHTPAAFGVAGMAAIFAATVRAPLTGIVLILEMTHNYEQLFALLIATTVAFLVAERAGCRPIYESLLESMLQAGPAESESFAEPTLVDLAVEHGSAMDGRLVKDLGLPAGCLLVTVKRGGREFVPGGATQLRVGDSLTVIVSGDTLAAYPLLRNQARAD